MGSAKAGPVGYCLRRCWNRSDRRRLVAGPAPLYETFAKAYEAKLRLLVPPRRSGFGADRGEGSPSADPDNQAVGDP